MPSEQFERTLRERFAQAEIPPPAGLWDRIEAGVAPPVQPKRRFLWIWWSMAALLFCSVGLAWVFQPSSPIDPTTQVVKATPEVPVLQNQESSDHPQEILSEPTEPETGSLPAHAHDANGFSMGSQPLTAHTTNAVELSRPDQTAPSQPAMASLTESDTSVESAGEVMVNEDLPQENSQNSGLAGNPAVGEKSNISLFDIEHIVPIDSRLATLDQSGSIIPLHPVRRVGKWAVDLSVQSGYATKLFSTLAIEKSFQTDYAGYANRSLYSPNGNGQIATVRFPRWHHTVSLETSRTIHARWRISLGLDLQAGLGGIATLGEIQSQLNTPTGPGSSDDIVVEQSSISLGTPSNFTHISLNLPIRASYISSLGRGTLEHSIGVSFNRNWTIAEPQTQLESIAFGLNSDETEIFSDISLPPPVLNTNLWHSDIRARSRYFFPSGSAFQPFVGAELQTQITPAFGGDAAVNQRSFLMGIELGLRIR